jgi:hypothetical protein
LHRKSNPEHNCRHFRLFLSLTEEKLYVDVILVKIQNKEKKKKKNETNLIVTLC